jgi:hypothetical protein
MSIARTHLAYYKKKSPPRLLQKRGEHPMSYAALDDAGHSLLTTQPLSWQQKPVIWWTAVSGVESQTRTFRSLHASGCSWQIFQ